jgi:exonuclease SbcD
MPSLKIFHCADLHLGLPFRQYPEGLAEARFSSLEKMIEKANSEHCDLFVVAGDLFDTLKVPARDVLRAAKILGRFEKVCLVLPGNHDFHSGASDDFWRNFELPDHGRMLLLRDGRSYPLKELGIDACIYAAPCTTKKSDTHAVGWMVGAPRAEAKFHIGLAHGSFEGLSPDLEGDYFPMKKVDLDRCGLDLWMLGHIHVQFPPRAPGQSDKIFYSGTHEPDGFDCRHDGKAWLITLGDDKKITAESLTTGQFRFRFVELELKALAALEEFSRKFSDEEARRTLLKLKIRGALAREEFERFGEILETLKRRFFFVKADFSALGVRMAKEDIDATFAKESFPHRLLTELSGAPADAEALQAAYELLQETAAEARK